MHPVLTTFGPFEISSSFSMMLLGAVLSVMLAIRRAQSQGFPEISEIIDVTLLSLFLGFWGSRILFVLHHIGINSYTTNTTLSIQDDC